ncbi:IS1182 family transposase (plasmid) [Streptomyces sp. NBC_00335]|uniref:IS1182 family transposase n=1 Tax=unclassified Streptomyces TaxID=2593676 RepID=UPI002257B5FD|nr:MULTISPECIES: IS1182 family transposase [unclassified Streptomyces]MCX5410147.1 IS1182 family transposase [Streptomyces sp. NBC_00086]
MCVHPRSGSVIPELTVRVARASNPRGTTAMAIRDHLEGLWSDEDFEQWYPQDGRPGLSPAQLATVSVLQFLLELSDRQAAASVRCRIDFKYALGMELEDPGFHHSVLADFRERLSKDSRADKLLGLALEKIKAVGLIRERGRQRTDSTHVLAAVRDLTRLELVTEAMRAALEELARRAPHELVGVVTQDWGRRYGRAARLGRNPSRPKGRVKETGDDVHLLLRYVDGYLPALRDGEQVQALRQIFLQNYWIDAQERLWWRETDTAGLPSSAVAIVSPYDTAARFARRGETRWKGFLAHVTETCDHDAVNVITDVTTTKAAVQDSRSLPVILAQLDRRELLPAEHFVDQGYTSVTLKQHVARDFGVGLVGPVRARTTWQSRRGNVFRRDAFVIDWDAKQVTCPQGKKNQRWVTPPSVAPYIQVRFAKSDCGPCPIKTACTKGDLRALTFLPRELHDLQSESRTEQQTQEWLSRYSLRAGIESTINEFVNGHGMRQCRYRSEEKAHVQPVLTAIAVKLERIAAHLPPAPESQPRTPTALQDFLDRQGVPRPRSWRVATHPNG